MKNSADYRTVARVMHAFDERAWESSGAEEIAARVGESREFLETVFRRWAGVDLTRFLHGLGVGQIRKRLVDTEGLFAAGEAGSGNPAFHARECRMRSLTSGQGKGVTISYGLHPTPFGDCLLAATIGGEICHLSFTDEGEGGSLPEELGRSWPQAAIIGDHGEIGSLVERIFSPGRSEAGEPLRLLVKGTSFQLKVWQALLVLPFGALVSYQGLAAAVGHPAACRAVAGAVAANPVSWLIPCHRVIRKSGAIHRYRWGSSRKKAMLGWEACRL